MQIDHLRPQKRSRGFPGKRINDHEYRELVIAAYHYGFPVFEQARLVYNFSYAASNPRRVPVNTFAHARSLTGVAEQKVTTPNNDTLYSSAVIDLSGGPVWLDVPDFGDRYYSIALFDAFTNVFRCIGSRLQGGGATSYLLAGPGGTEKPSKAPLLQAPGNHIVALARIHADGPEEYAQIHALQDQMILRPTGTVKDRKLIAPVPNAPLNFAAVVNQVLQESPPPAADLDFLEQISQVGIGPGIPGLSAHQADLWDTYYPLARTRLQQISASFGRTVAGWEYPPSTIGDFDTDYLARAVIGLKGLWANLPAEQTYTLALTDHEGQALVGGNTYKLRLPKERVEDGAFWSLSMYARTPQGQLNFFHNAIDRHAIKSNTPGLLRNSDGSLDIVMANTSPGDDDANWLPSPSGQFVMVMRIYAPRTDGLGKSEFYPPVIRQ